MKNKTVKPRNNGKDKAYFLLLLKFINVNVEIYRNTCEGTGAKFVIVRFSPTLGSVIVGFYCIHDLKTKCQLIFFSNFFYT